MDKRRLQQKLSAVCNPPCFTKISELEVGSKYRILSFNNITTTYGDRVFVDIVKKGSQSNTVRVILPHRFNNLRSEVDDLNASISDGMSISLTYNGPWLNSSNVAIEYEDSM